MSERRTRYAPLLSGGGARRGEPRSGGEPCISGIRGGGELRGGGESWGECTCKPKVYSLTLLV